MQPHFFRRYSRSKDEFVEEPWLAWMIWWRDGWVMRGWNDWWVGDWVESPAFDLYAAMVYAERIRYAEERRRREGRVRRLFRLEKLSDAQFERWLRRHYPPKQERRARRAVAYRDVGQWERLVNAEAQLRLEREGREPTRITID